MTYYTFVNDVIMSHHPQIFIYHYFNTFMMRSVISTLRNYVIRMTLLLQPYDFEAFCYEFAYHLSFCLGQ